MAPIYEWTASPLDKELVEMLEEAGVRELVVLRRRVGDGELRAIRRCEGIDNLWHLTVTHWRLGWRSTRRPPRWPSWEEINDARRELLPLNSEVVLELPPEDAARIDGRIHLWERRRPDNSEAGRPGQVL